METFAEFQRRRNASFYSKKAGEIYSSFRTFAHSKKFAEANAREFLRRAPRKGKLRVYEVGVGDGTFALNFMKALRKWDEGVEGRTTYMLWDFSEKGAERAAERAAERMGDFAHETVVAPAWEWKRMRNADCVKCCELLDDLPTRMLVRRGAHIMEVMEEGGAFLELEARLDAETFLFMEGMPQGHWVPVPEVGLGCLRGWRGELKRGGWIDVFDYGFADARGMRELPAHIWNSSIWREFSGQITVDVNFAFLKSGVRSTGKALQSGVGGRYNYPKEIRSTPDRNSGRRAKRRGSSPSSSWVEAQKDYVERALGMDLWEVDLEGEGQNELSKWGGGKRKQEAPPLRFRGEVDLGRLDYLSHGEVRKNEGKLREAGYDVELLLRGGEKSDYLHMEISKLA